MSTTLSRQELQNDLTRLLGRSSVFGRPIDRIARSSDASLYRLVPEVVVRPRGLDDVRALLDFATRRERHLTFRTAGTSLSGQALSDDILVELAPFFRNHEVLDRGERVRAAPGVVGGHLNRLLAPYRRRIGPDPASIDAAMMGGIFANNSSGMCCGVVQNTYHTLDSAVFLLADGTRVDTGDKGADLGLQRDRPDLHAALITLRDEVRADAALVARIRAKVARKNTMGYSLQAFLDHGDPAQILAHLLVGSQGTLGFVASMTLHTVPDPPARATALLYFKKLVDAGAAVDPLAEAGAAALEIMDAACLRSLEGEPPPLGVGSDTAGLLAEFQCDDAGDVASAVRRAKGVLDRFELLAAPDFSTDAAMRDHLWKLRKGTFATIGGRRPRGTTLITEDVLVPRERLASGIADLQGLFARYEYRDASIVAHAKDGNLHFLLAEDFSRSETVDRYERFMDELADVIVDKYDGALKAEHGSGRNMAPFVQREWGERAYGVMLRIKGLLDPAGILNPGVVLNDDPKIHLKNFKPFPAVHDAVDKCIECGFCEPRCPSRFLTLSPRQRIVALREESRLRAAGVAAAAELQALRADFDYEGLTTCAGDSMCQASCPVKIDTGAFMKVIRAGERGGLERRLAQTAAQHMTATLGLARLGQRVASALRSVPGGSSLLRAAGAPSDLALPRPAPPLPRPRPLRGGRRRVVYFPTCLTRAVGSLPGESARSLAEPVGALLDWAGYDYVHPDGVAGLCCGMPFSSKAFPEAAERSLARALAALREASRGGQDDVVTDASPCALTLGESVMDFATFWARRVLPGREHLPKLKGEVILHPTCSLVKQGGLGDLVTVASAHAESVFVPASAECCGFAGDKGFFVPELTRSATLAEAAEVRQRLLPTSRLVSTCRTCEIGMTRAVGRPYRSIVDLIQEAVDA